MTREKAATAVTTTQDTSEPSTSTVTGPNGETAQFIYVTPEMAVEFLAANIDRNRNVKKSRINGYVRDIQTDNWVLTGEAVKSDVRGRLIDGQNRCQAIVSAGRGA